MTDNIPRQVPEALLHASYLESIFVSEEMSSSRACRIAKELRRLHAYCQELEAQVIRDCMTHVQNPGENEHVAGDVSKNGAELNMSAQQPAPATQQVGAPASIAGPMQFGGCPDCGSRNCVARECTRTVSHKAQAIPGVQWQCGPQASGFTAQAAESVPAPLHEGEWINDAGRIKWLLWRVQDLEAKPAARARREIESLRARSVEPSGEYPALPEPLEIDWPELHSHALGCGVEDRGLHSRYECAEYGWQDGVDKCAERVPEQIFDADQMRAYADTTHALRASRGQEPQQEPSYTSAQLAEMVLSDCGHSSNYTPLLNRVAARIDAHVERCLESKKTPQQEAQESVLDAFERKERNILHAHVAAALVAELRDAIDAARAAQEGKSHG